MKLILTFELVIRLLSSETLDDRILPSGTGDQSVLDTAAIGTLRFREGSQSVLDVVGADRPRGLPHLIPH